MSGFAIVIGFDTLSAVIDEKAVAAHICPRGAMNRLLPSSTVLPNSDRALLKPNEHQYT